MQQRLVWEHVGLLFLVNDSIMKTMNSLYSDFERVLHMNLAKLTSAGQITVPVEIRRLLRLRTGDKILFTQNETGEIVIGNASVNAIQKAQTAMSGVAESLDNPSEDEIQSWVSEVRYGKDIVN